MKPRKTTITATMIFILAFLPILLTAGPTGSIKGKVIDKDTGQPIPGVSIFIKGIRTGAVSGPDGTFEIKSLKPGKYDITATTIGYEKAEIKVVTVQLKGSTELVIEMKKIMQNLGDTIKVKEYRDLIDKFEVSNRVEISDKKYASETQTIIRNEFEESELQQIYRSPAPVSKRPGNPHFPPAHGGTSIVNGEPYDAMFFEDYGTNPFVDTEDDHLSTFAIDVDDASFVMARSYLRDGNLPPDEAVRVEEFINHFDYSYERPYEHPFGIDIEGAPSYFGENCYLMRVGIQGMEIFLEERKSANLVFVIDVSGSMARENRLGLVKHALRKLVEHLEPRDRVGIVIYGSRGEIHLEPTSVRYKRTLISAINSLHSSGATNAEEGLRLGYQMAQRMFDRRKINRIILCSDGVANVGVTKPEDLLIWIKGHAERGITLTTVGFGMGNYNDILMEKLGNKGNGMYAYVDDRAQAEKVFLDNLTGMLQVIARDVKIQVDFNPDVVRSYRLIGYENRKVEDHKFRDDREDGGEIGAGHQVTALYEIKLYERKKRAHLGTIFIRFKDPDTHQVDEIARSILLNDFDRSFFRTSDDFKLAAAAAEFGEILGKSYWARGSRLADVRNLVNELEWRENGEQIREFLDMLNMAERLEDRLAER